MHSHRTAAFLVGCLILGSLFMIFVATQNFATVDRVLAAPQPQEAAQMFQTLGPDNARILLRYLAGEENRLFFTSWELTQIALGVLLTALLLLTVKKPALGGNHRRYVDHRPVPAFSSDSGDDRARPLD